MTQATPSTSLLRERLEGGIEKLTSLVAQRTDGDPENDQIAANELAWDVAWAEAGLATQDWARRDGSAAAAAIADAALLEALATIEGRTATQSIEAGHLHAEVATLYPDLASGATSPEHRLLEKEVQDFADRQIRPVAAAIHQQNSDIPEAILHGLGELGIFGLSIPEKYGGSRGDTDDHVAMLIVTEQLSRASLAAGGSLVTRPEILVRALLRGGTEEQRQHWLPDIAAGTKLVAVATTEPDHGSDLAGITCRAQRDGTGWRISGAKLWCTFAGRAELIMALVRTSDEGHRGLSVFVIDKPRFAGHSFRLERDGGSLEGRAIPTIGYRGMHTFELAFREFPVPDTSLVGMDSGLNRGFYLQMESFSVGRLQTAARAVGLMQAALDEAWSYSRERRVFGSPVGNLLLPKSMLGRMVVRLAAARCLAHEAARRLEEGRGQMAASLAKLFASRMAELVTRDAMQLHGGMGYAEETTVSRLFVDARVLSIFEGAEEVLALRVIAKSLLRGDSS